MKRKFCMILILCLIVLNIPITAQAGNIINVKTAPYNAAGDGIADDTAAIVSAINASQAGDTVYFPKGTYNLSAGLYPKSDTKLMGESKEESILRYTYLPAPWGSLIYGGGESENTSNTKNIELCNFTVDGNLIESKDGRALCFSYTSGIYIHDMIIRDIGMPTSAINFRVSVTDSVIQNNEIYNIGVGARYGEPILPDQGLLGGAGVHVAWGSKRVSILGNKIINANRNGIGCDNGARYLIIRDNVISGTGINSSAREALGLELWQDCDYSIVEDNTVDTWISLVRSKYLAVRRNRVEMPKGIESQVADPYGYELHSLGSIYTDNVSIGHSIGLIINGLDPEQLAPKYNYFGNNIFAGAWNYGGEFIASMQAGNFNQYFYKNSFINTRKDVYPGKAGSNVGFNGHNQNFTFEQCKFNGGRMGILLDTAPGIDGIYIFNSEMKNNTKAGAAYYVEPGGAMTKTYNPSNGSPMTAFEVVNTEVFDNEDDGLHPNIPFTEEKPVCAFSAPDTALTGEAVSFINQSTDAQEMDAYLWDFGDGLPAMTENPTYTYEKPGIYTVTLIAWNQAGRASRASKQIVVTDGSWPPADTRVYGAFSLYDESGAPATMLVPRTTLHAEMPVANHTAQAQKITLILALLREDGTMADMQRKVTDIPLSGIQTAAVSLALPPNVEGLTAVAMAWESLSSLAPVKKSLSCTTP